MDALTLHCEMQDTSPLQEDDFKRCHFVGDG